MTGTVARQLGWAGWGARRSQEAGLALIALVVLGACVASAATIRVGPAERVHTIAQAAALAQDDDVVEIAPGDYLGDVTVWTQKRLTIRGVGQRPVLRAAGKIAEGKAIWVIRNGDFSISNIEFRDARVDDGNGAGIRFERGKLSIVRCGFFNNQVGLMTSNFADAELSIADSIFAEAPRQKSPLPHLVYVGQISVLRVTGSRFHSGYFGHLLKSRARLSDLRYNLLVDGAAGRASYEAEFPNGGEVTLVGNVLGQSSETENRTVLSYGAEGGIWPRNSLTMVHNTFYSEGSLPGRFLQVFQDRVSPQAMVLSRNNLIAGTGLFTMGVGGAHQGNVFAPAAALGDPSMMDFTLDASSWLRGMADPIADDTLRPKFEHLVPGGVTPMGDRVRWVPGALQTPSVARP